MTALFAVSLLAAIVRPAAATEVGYSRKFGLGVVIGDPTGLSAKCWIAPTNALDFGLGFWGYGVNNRCVEQRNCTRYGYSNGTFNMDYLWQSNIVRGQAQLDWHIGAGGRADLGGRLQRRLLRPSRARAPLGLDLMFNNPGFLEVFFEIAPAFVLVPGFWFEIEGGLGVRFYF